MFAWKPALLGGSGRARCRKSSVSTAMARDDTRQAGYLKSRNAGTVSTAKFRLVKSSQIFLISIEGCVPHHSSCCEMVGFGSQLTTRGAVGRGRMSSQCLQGSESSTKKSELGWPQEAVNEVAGACLLT